MAKLPTDLQILRRIYSTYLDVFVLHSREVPVRSTKIHVPIDVRNMAAALNTDPDLLFGRLYYHLDYKYRYVQSDGAVVSLFSLRVGDDLHCVKFPYLAAIVSERNVEHRRNLWAIGLSIAALIFSAGSIIAQLVTASGG
jgi:hypothetical protein